MYLADCSPPKIPALGVKIDTLLPQMYSYQVTIHLCQERNVVRNLILWPKAASGCGNAVLVPLGRQSLRLLWIGLIAHR